MKELKVYISIPEDWIDSESPTMWAATTIRDMAKEEIKKAVIEQYITKITLPKIEIKAEEVKDRMLTLLAERALEERV